MSNFIPPADAPKTIASLADAYVTALKAKGQSELTVAVARRTLDRLIAHLGEGKEISKTLPVHVAGFFTATKVKKNGQPADEKTVKQIGRIVRGAFEYALQQGWVASLPMAGDEKARTTLARAERKAKVKPSTKTIPPATTTRPAPKPTAGKKGKGFKVSKVIGEVETRSGKAQKVIDTEGKTRFIPVEVEAQEPDDQKVEYTCTVCGKHISAATADDNGGRCNDC